MYILRFLPRPLLNIWKVNPDILLKISLNSERKSEERYPILD